MSKIVEDNRESNKGRTRITQRQTEIDNQEAQNLLGSKNLGFYVFRTLMYIGGKPWSKQDV